MFRESTHQYCNECDLNTEDDNCPDCEAETITVCDTCGEMLDNCGCDE